MYNDAMLGVKTCRAARTCFAGRCALALTLWTVSVRTRAQASAVISCRGAALWVHVIGDGALWSCSFVWPPTIHGGALLWRHMHMVYKQNPIEKLFIFTMYQNYILTLTSNTVVIFKVFVSIEEESCIVSLECGICAECHCHFLHFP